MTPPGGCLEDLKSDSGAVSLPIPPPPVCSALLAEAGVAMTPGTDFEQPGSGRGERKIRISYAGATEDMEEGMRLMGAWFEGNVGRFT